MARNTILPPDQIRARLRHTWPVFFARYGSFTAVQRLAIPPILDGHNALVISATASGKTEAAIAPLLERHILKGKQRRGQLRILYLCPTRALVRDLYERLRLPLERLDVALSMKSGDTGPVSTTRPPTVLVTTPESTDSLLTRAPRLLAALDAIVLDEIHLFDGSPRGDHLQCLLRRIEGVRRYHQRQKGSAAFRPLQRVALSATVPDPAGVARRYLVGDGEKGGEVEIVQAAGGRALQVEITRMAGLGDLVRALARRSGGQVALRKSLIFCNTRNEVEQTAAYLRQHLPYDAAIFVHYSNIDPAMRRQVEDDFALANVAICVSSSTLELGIDIGSIDDIVLLGPPPTMTSFLQRIGRGGRRSGVAQALCLARSPLEEVHFQALTTLARAGKLLPDHLSRNPAFVSSPAPFRSSVLIQQIFSILKQSPTGGIRLADLRRVAPPTLPDETLHRIFDHLVDESYLRTGRLGEWRADVALKELADAHEIYSNIGSGPRNILIIDAYTGDTIAQTDRPRFQGEALLMRGRPVEVAWRDRYRIAIRPDKRSPVDETLSFFTKPMAIPLEVSQAVAAQLGAPPDALTLLHAGEQTILFHFWGDLYGALLAGLLRSHFDDEPVAKLNEHALILPVPLSQLPLWDDYLLRRQLLLLPAQLEDYLQLGRFHPLLPPDLAHEAVIEHCRLPLFEHLYHSSEIITPSAGLRRSLIALLG